MTSLLDDNDVLKDIIRHSEYLNNIKSGTSSKRHVSSLSYLVDKTVTQSDCIRLGIAMEELLRTLIVRLSPRTLRVIKRDNKKGCIEKDHLLVDSDNKTLYYAEIKGNLNLDTEKSKMTAKKCLNVVNELSSEPIYEGYTINWNLVGIRYTDMTCIPNVISSKYNSIISVKDHLKGVNDYLRIFDISYEFTEDSYKTFINQVMNEII